MCSGWPQIKNYPNMSINIDYKRLEKDPKMKNRLANHWPAFLFQMHFMHSMSCVSPSLCLCECVFECVCISKVCRMRKNREKKRATMDNESILCQIQYYENNGNNLQNFIFSTKKVKI